MKNLKIILSSRYLTAIYLFFAVIFIANVALVYIALSSDTGLVAKDYYKRGVEYNKSLRQKRKLTELGYSGSIEIVEDSDGYRKIYPKLYDKNSLQIRQGVTFRVYIYRPSDSHYDKHYEINNINRLPVRHQFPLPGKWKINYDVFMDGEIIFKGRKQMFIAGGA